jgi:hypothetical protein
MLTKHCSSREGPWHIREGSVVGAAHAVALAEFCVRGPERRFHFEIEARYGSFSWSSWSNASNEFSRIDTEKPLVIFGVCRDLGRKKC